MNLPAPPTHVRNGQELDNLVNTFTDICGEALKGLAKQNSQSKAQTPMVERNPGEPQKRV